MPCSWVPHRGSGERPGRALFSRDPSAGVLLGERQVLHRAERVEVAELVLGAPPDRVQLAVGRRSEAKAGPGSRQAGPGGPVLVIGS